MSKSEKMYKDSPKLKRKESGEVGIEKPSQADAENMGIEGNPSPGAGDGMPVDVHQAERAEVSKKHVQELKDMHKRHAAEFEAMHKRQNESEKDSK